VLTHKRHAKDVQKSLNFGNPNKFPHISPKRFKVVFTCNKVSRVSLGFKVYWVIRA